MIGLNHSYEDAGPPALPVNAPGLTARLFSLGGILHEKLGLEHRIQQERMARAVADAMTGDQPLLFEAGTGVGKSLAYLLPGIIHAMDQSRQLIVSTHTISLQEQLNQKDIPLCRRIFSADEATQKYAAFRSALLLGKGNYLCTTRLASALKDQTDMLPTEEHTELQRIADWAKNSKEGLRHELNPLPPPDVWELVNADSSACSRKYCSHEHCFYQRAKMRIRKAHLLILNHSLLFALLNSAGETGGDTRGVLFPDDFVVLDEAHTMPEVATAHCGLRISSYGVDRLFKYLYNPKTKRGLLHRLGTPMMQQLVADCLEASRHFFAFIAERVLTHQAIVRVREEGFAEPWLNAPLQALHKAVRTKADQTGEGRDRDELLEQAGKLEGLLMGLRQFLSVAEPDRQVYWVERTGRRQTIVHLRTAPIDIAPFIRETLFLSKTSVVLTSATLAIGGRMEPFCRRVGAEALRAEMEHSPFDYEHNMRVYVAADMPLPDPRNASLALETLADYVDFCTRRTAGGSLVLFTSYADMRRVAEIVEPIYEGCRRPFFMQGRDHHRTELARLLQKSGNGVLFGTDSFWTGVDVPGEALSQVIITRLPFEVPTHPVLEARTEWVRARGGNPFSELTLPDALMKFRQGIGRLIRGASDRGVITLLDSRVIQKSYGRLFLECLPQRRVIRMNQQNRAERFQPYR